MWSRWAVKITLGLHLGANANFIPFANVEELKPKRIEDFCLPGEPFPGPDGKGRLRRCEHHFKKQLEDGGDVELGWKMDVDPSKILSLDTEAEYGVHLQSCQPRELEIELPDSHLERTLEGSIIVGSRFVHNCFHLKDRHLYHRVAKVLSVHRRDVLVPGKSARERRNLVKMTTQELDHISHAVPSLTFHFSWMPQEARDVQAFPEMRTDYGINRPYLRKLRKQRRLLGFPDLPDSFKKLSGVDEDSGGFQSGGASDGQFDTENGVLNLMPKQLSNFGWNWNFFCNTTQEPDFEMDAPGARAVLKVRQPYIKVHSGIYLNFSSEFGGLTTAPKVKWTWGIKGHGRVQARIFGSMNTTGDAGSDPFSAFKIPVLEELEDPVWFEKIDLATGTLPLSMEPGFKFSATMYHHGTFRGAIRVGGRTHGTINPSLTYDSLKGFDAKFEGDLKDTELWPPLWMIFTKSFEIGMMLKPSLLMQGDFAGLERATMAIQPRPYANVSITREGHGQRGFESQDLKTLTVYPMRVIGINSVDFNKKYKVKVTANGRSVETTAQVNWGQVEFREKISHFACGDLPQKTLLNPSETKIEVTLIEVDNTIGSAVQTTLGTGQVACGSLLDQECSPSPSNVVIFSSAGKTLATVQVALVWSADPEPWFASKIRGLGFSFPQVILREDTLTAAFPNSETPVPGSKAASISLHLVHGGQTYVIGLTGTIGSQQSALAGDSTIEFGPGFTDTWLPCQANVQECQSPRLELYAGGTLVGAADLPLIEFNSATAMQGTGTGFMSAAKSGEMNVPSTIALSPPGETGTTVALATMNARVDMVLGCSMFLSPRAQMELPRGSVQKLVWTVADIDRSKEYEFTLESYILTAVSPENMKSYAEYRQIDGQVLAPISDGKRTLTATCEAMDSENIPADAAPCSFSYSFPFHGAGYTDGAVVIVAVQWASGGSSHVLYSPPIELNGGSNRRLSSEPVGPIIATPRRLWSQDAWNARMKKHSKSCNRRDLRFNFGLGLLMRGKVDGISVPKGFPMIGGLNEQPDLTTGFRDIMSKQPGEEAEDAFGGKDGLLCQAGLCQGLLPGCSAGGPKTLSFPKLVFDFNRPFHFNNNSNGKFNGVVKQALAYAFSTLPEMVDVIIQQMNRTEKRKTRSPAAITTNWRTQASNPAPAPSLDWPTKPIAPAPAPAQSVQAQDEDSLSDAFNKWWSGAESRRLTTPLGDTDELPDVLQDHQVRLHFSKGVPFVIDRPLVDMMLKNGYFNGLEDIEDDDASEQGPLEIIGFSVHSGVGSEQEDILEQANQADPTVSASVGVPTPLAFVMVASVSLLAFIVVRRQAYRHFDYTQDLSHGPECFE